MLLSSKAGGLGVGELSDELSALQALSGRGHPKKTGHVIIFNLITLEN